MDNAKIILKRIAQVIGVSNNKELAEKLGVSYNTLNTWIKRNNVPMNIITEIVQKRQLNYDWLLTGKDNWGMPLNTSNVIENLKSFFNLKTDEELIKYLNDNLSYKIDSNTLQEWKKTNKVPHGLLAYIAKENNVSIDELLNNTTAIQSSCNNDIEVNYYPEVYASAGYGASNTDLVPQKVKLSSFILDNFKISNTSKIDLIRVYGDSMEPTFQNGDIAIVERINDVSQIKNGDTIIANVEGELFIKKIEKIPFKQAIILKSSNKNYDDIIVQDFDRFQVVAVVRGKMRVI